MNTRQYLSYTVQVDPKSEGFKVAKVSETNLDDIAFYSRIEGRSVVVDTDIEVAVAVCLFSTQRRLV